MNVHVVIDVLLLKYFTAYVIISFVCYCPTNLLADLQSLQFTMNKILFKIFGAMSKEMFREISKCFGINPLEEVISARRINF